MNWVDPDGLNPLWNNSKGPLYTPGEGGGGGYWGGVRTGRSPSYKAETRVPSERTPGTADYAAKRTGDFCHLKGQPRDPVPVTRMEKTIESFRMIIKLAKDFFE